MIYECTDRRGQTTVHVQSDDLTSREAMQRLGVLDRSFKVVCWPQGRPDQAHCVQQLEVREVSKP
jgi:hypothetical protein